MLFVPGEVAELARAEPADAAGVLPNHERSHYAYPPLTDYFPLTILRHDANVGAQAGTSHHDQHIEPSATALPACSGFTIPKSHGFESGRSAEPGWGMTGDISAGVSCRRFFVG